MICFFPRMISFCWVGTVWRSHSISEAISSTKIFTTLSKHLQKHLHKLREMKRMRGNCQSGFLTSHFGRLYCCQIKCYKMAIFIKAFLCWKASKIFDYKIRSSLVSTYFSFLLSACNVQGIVFSVTEDKEGADFFQAP